MTPGVKELFEVIGRNAPLVEPLILNAPTSEWGVVFLLGQLSAHGGFQFVGGSGSFPDCNLRVRLPTHETDLRVELELSATEFIRHRHPAEGCDAVICWMNNANLALPTLGLSSLFPKVPTPVTAAIEWDSKQSKLVEVFQHFHEWLTAQGFPSIAGGGKAETNTLTYLYNGKSLCSLQFSGAGANEYVRFRFYKKELDLHAILQPVVATFKRVNSPAAVVYSGDLATEEHIDVRDFDPAVCGSVTDSLAAIFREKQILPRR